MTTTTQTANKTFVFKSEHKTFNAQTKSMKPFATRDKTMYGWPITAGDALVLGTTTYEPGQLQRLSLEPVKLAMDSYVGRYYWDSARVTKSVKEHLGDRDGWTYMIFHKSSGKRMVHGFILTDDRGYLIDKWVVGPTHKSSSIIYEAIRHLSNADDIEVEHVESKIRDVEYTIRDTYKISIPGTNIEQEVVERRIVTLSGEAQDQVTRHYTSWEEYPQQEFLNATKLMKSQRASRILAEQFKAALTKSLRNIVDQRDLFPLAWKSIGKTQVSP
ncbi:MAG: hypothetical protein QF535_09320, partial [Anaerolineales bacterium]|nr:hypothetical protein [Anaerolineales bacterium]